MTRVRNPYATQRETAEKTNRQGTVDAYGDAALRGLLENLRTGVQAFEHGARAQLFVCAADLRSWASACRARAEAISSGAEPSDDARADAARWRTVADEIDQFATDWLEEARDR